MQNSLSVRAQETGETANNMLVKTEVTDLVMS